jgi:hypothetical protein
MAKIHQNAEKFPIQWNGKVVGGEKQGDSIPSDITLCLRARQDRLNKILDDEDKKKRLIRLICRVKGEEKAYDETKQVGDIQLKLDDVDMVIGKITKLNVSGMKDWNEVPWNYEYDK